MDGTRCQGHDEGYLSLLKDVDRGPKRIQDRALRLSREGISKGDWKIAKDVRTKVKLTLGENQILTQP